ncbi:MAG: 6-pyruvoyl trahydropterin synthase family protein [Bacteroidales bacterium]
MIVRKLYKFEGAHIVRNCYTDRCKFSLHGHSYKVEVMLHGSSLDNSGMLLDFSIMKLVIGDLIDSFDHTWLFWERESDEFQSFVKNNSERWISFPANPSAESIAVVLFKYINELIAKVNLNNGESQDIKVQAVRVHETETGYAEATIEDINLVGGSMTFSQAIKDSWKRNPLEIITNGLTIEKPLIQIK